MEHPILFSTTMIQAIIANKKTQTRRLAKISTGIPDKIKPNALPPWRIGDKLWVRETWNRALDTKENAVCYLYRADNIDHPLIKWRPSIHMPREACRMILEIDALHLQRLQDISVEDVNAEGVSGIHSFRALWNQTYKPLAQRWESNPWVWRINFHIAERKDK